MAAYGLFLKPFKADKKEITPAGPTAGRMGEPKPVKDAADADQNIFQLKRGACPPKA